MWAFDTATNQRKLLIWLARLELNVTPAYWAICRKAYQSRPAVALVAEHLKLATGFFESGYPEGGFDHTVVNDAEPRRVNLPPDEYKQRVSSNCLFGRGDARYSGYLQTAYSAEVSHGSAGIFKLPIRQRCRVVQLFSSNCLCGRGIARYGLVSLSCLFGRCMVHRHLAYSLNCLFGRKARHPRLGGAKLAVTKLGENLLSVNGI